MEKTFSFEGNQVHITVSLGVACTEDPSVRLTELFHQADQALYQAKAAGRNQVARYKG
jgi:diguanylate cyclase